MKKVTGSGGSPPRRRLRRADCSAPGIRRVRRGRGFSYLDACGSRVTDPDVLDRIRGLVLPPAWEDVWICTDPWGHIQALGTDARGRRQYRYHDLWRQRRDREKFDHMLEFAEALPALRERAAQDLVLDGLPRERVLACAARLLDLGSFRIGTEGYAEENQTFGLATIGRQHVHLDGDVIEFDYMSKGGKRRIQSFADPDVRAVIETLKRRRGGSPELLAWRGRREAPPDRRKRDVWVDVRSGDINAYIKEATGGDFTAKDFRTWKATVLAGVALGVSDRATSPTARKRAVARAMQEVAHYLGNTPAVCRSSYVDPRIVDRYRAGATISGVVEQLHGAELTGDLTLSSLNTIEAAVLELLTDDPDPRRERRAA